VINRETWLNFDGETLKRASFMTDYFWNVSLRSLLECIGHCFREQSCLGCVSLYCV